VIFSAGNANLNSATFGLVTGQANGSRDMQFGLKLYW
jgi:hypothetical protein